VQANANNDGIDLAGTGPGVVGEDGPTSLLDMLFGGDGAGGLGQGGVQRGSGGDSASDSSAPKRAEKYRREGTIIDVDVQEDDKPFQ
jgi:hypothetical protein